MNNAITLQDKPRHWVGHRVMNPEGVEFEVLWACVVNVRLKNVETGEEVNQHYYPIRHKWKLVEERKESKRNTVQ